MGMNWQTLGFESQKRLFERLAADEGEQLAHAYIFSGQETIGKRSFALELARHINAIEPDRLDPDFLFVSNSSSETQASISIDEIRTIKNFLSLSAYGRHKIVVIDNAHSMTPEAQNALLKVLEEPSARSLLILVTHASQQFLPTISSRCQEIVFNTHPRAVVASFLESQAQLSSAQREFLASFANGRLGLLKTIIAQQLFPQIKSAIEDMAGLLKAPLSERLAKAQAYSEQDVDDKVLYWFLYMHTRLDKPGTSAILRNLLDLYSIRQEPQMNQRLALETFMLNL